MKKINIILSAILIACLSYGMWTYINYRDSFIPVSFESIPKDTTVGIYNKNDKKIDTVTEQKNSTELRFGQYYTKVDSDNYSDKKYNFEVNKPNQTILLDIDYSKDKLSDLLALELSTLHQIIRDRYAGRVANFEITDGSLLKKGEWYGAILYVPGDDLSAVDPHRIVLKKENDQWEILAEPQIIIPKTYSPAIPTDVIEAVNNLSIL